MVWSMCCEEEHINHMQKPEEKLTASRGRPGNECDGRHGHILQEVLRLLEAQLEFSLALMAPRIERPDLIHLACFVLLMGKLKFRIGKASNLGSFPGRSLNSYSQCFFLLVPLLFLTITSEYYLKHRNRPEDSGVRFTATKPPPIHTH